jgi:glucose-6-phosphate isomerase
MNVRFDPKYSHIPPEETERAIREHKSLIEQVRCGEIWNDRWLGWFPVREAASAQTLVDLRQEAERVRRIASTMIVIGIGGSNRGAMAAIQALHRSLVSPTRIVWAGDSLSAAGLQDALEAVRNESVVLNIIAKDFRTLEPGVAFRMLRGALIEKYGAEYPSRIVVTGSHGEGQLFGLAQAQGYRFLEFPESIGGRFSVLSNVGLFPMAVAGVDIARLIGGAANMEQELKAGDIFSNPAVRYAVNRNLLFSKGFGVESLVVFEPDLIPLARWWTQLFAETEGKTPDAVFPTYFSYSEDLHAVGQYVQQGRRCIFETYLGAFHKRPECVIAPSAGVADGFSYLDGKPFDELNQAVYRAAILAHSEDGVPCQELTIPEISEGTLGALFYFFMFACYVSASLIGVNPFTQDGVENYKKAMYRLLKSRPEDQGRESRR